MSERWKYQLKVGIFWGLFMSLMSTFMSEKKLAEEMQEGSIYWRLIINVVVGTFVMGYLFWKGRDPKNNSWSKIFRGNKNEKA
ncbi:MAG: hypothetical protein KA213_09320 [Flavobacterium sp.]|nr:hypothetical protein [Flavobacterium sp.]